jgi:hypothetical protein
MVQDRRPQISAAPRTLEYAVPFVVTGSSFGGDSEASDSSTQNSAVNYPITQLRSVESESIHELVPDPMTQFSDTTLTFSRLSPGIDPGWYYLMVKTLGIPSESVLVEMGCGVVITGHPTSETAAINETATFSVETQGGVSFQWQQCTTGNCGPQGDWVDIPGATRASYTTGLIQGSDSGTQFRVIASSPCTKLGGTSPASQPALLTVEDDEAPTASVLEPSGGEYWLLSDPGEDGLPGTGDDPPPREELITWSMTDNVRICRVEVSLLYSNEGGASYVAAPPGGGLPATFGPGGTCAFPGESTTMRA